MNVSVPSKSRFDLYRTVTDKIILAIETGVTAFVMPWHGLGGQITRPANAATEARYRGVNVIALWAQASVSGYHSGVWASYRQWEHLGAHVRKGEHGTVIVFYKKVEGDESSEAHEEGDRPRLVARASRVFNAEQVEGWNPPEAAVPSRVEAISAAEGFVTKTQATIRHGGEMACYRRTNDYIEMPYRERFSGTPTSSPTESYYGVLLHELTHWSGASHRLNRVLGKRFGDAEYSMEELVAELGAAFLCADFHIAHEPRPDHAAYINSWLKVLKSDHRAIFTAAGQAQKAVEYLRQITGENPQAASIQIGD